MALILAKSHGHHSAHLFEAMQETTGDTRKALCGSFYPASQLEMLPGLDGAMPCELCICEAPADLFPTSSRAVGELLPEDDETSADVYGVGLRGELVWHRIPQTPQLRQYEGRDVVVAECGSIAYVLFGTPPERYKPCPDCSPIHE